MNKCVNNTVFAEHNDNNHDKNSCFDIPAHTNIFDTLEMYNCFNDYVDDCDIIDRVTESSTVKCDDNDNVNGSVNMVNVNVENDFGNGFINYVNDKCPDKSNVSNKTVVNSAVNQSLHKRIVDYTDYVQLKDGAIPPDVLSKGTVSNLGT